MVREVTNAIYKDWRTIAYSLHMSREDVDNIEKKQVSEKDRTEHMLKIWQKKERGYDKISILAQACRACNFNELADELEQGLDENLLIEISGNIPEKKWRPFGFNLNFTDAELEQMEQEFINLLPRVRIMIANWRMRQSPNSDKILLLSQALHNCGLRRLELQVARGLDDDIMSALSVQIGTAWRILAITLGMTNSNITSLQDFSVDKQPYQMLMQWRRKQRKEVDVLGALHKGLTESGLPELAHELVQGVNDEMLDKIGTLVGDRWGLLSSHLGFIQDELKALQSENYSEFESIIMMLKKWRERHDYTRDRFEFLMSALRKCGLDDVADFYEKAYMPRSQVTMKDVSDEAANQDTRTKDHIAQLPHVQDINREIFVRVSKEVAFQDLARVMGLSNADTADIESRHQTNEQRVFQLLDRWRRRGGGGKRSISDLLQIIAHLGDYKYLIDDIIMMNDPNKQDVRPAIREQPMETNIPLMDEGQLDDTVLFPELALNSMIEVTHRTKCFGVIRWIGELPNGKNLVAGIELETPLTTGCTDGTFGKQRYFYCEPNKAIFVYLSQCRPDSRFPSESQTFRAARRLTSQDFGGFDSPEVSGYIDPPPKLQREFVGMQKGIQGDQNSCYLDTTLFSMFAYNSVFDPLLQRTAGKDDVAQYDDVQKVLRESIVNPLRKNGFVRADRVLQLREHLDNMGTTKGLMNEEKDPEEFLHTLLSEVFKSRALLKIRHGRSKVVDESNIYQIFMEKDESFAIPTVEQLLLQSFQEHDLKLTEAPSCLIVQMPRFGKDYKMYKRIVPSLQLDITNIIEEYPRQCVVCGNLAVFECKDCRSDEGIVDTINTKSYCANCCSTTHNDLKRSSHKPTELLIADSFVKDFFAVTIDKGYPPQEVDEHRQLMLEPKLMDLFAVICIRTSHYVSFVKAGRETESEWVFFDSMADRQGDQQGFNIPQITHLKDFRSWVNSKNITSSEGNKQLPELTERLLGDAYICMYSNTEERKLTYV